MRTTISFLLAHVLCPALVSAQSTELEPNEEIDSATAWTYGLTMSGGECWPPGFDVDYFRIVLPSDGVISFTVTTQGSGPQPGTLEFALFPKYGPYQQYHTLAGAPEETTVSFSHGCLGGDTMYVRLQQMNPGDGSCISYVMSYAVAPAVFANDAIPNDDFADPQPVPLGVPVEGHLNFLYDNTADHYGVTLPTDGMMRVIVEAEHADPETAATVEMYVNVNNGYYYPSIGASDEVTTDTFHIPCIAAQLVTVRVQMGNGSPTCGVSYRLRFDHVPSVFANDALPNDDFSDPQPVALDVPIEGHLDFFGETTSDHYGLTLPDDGTLRIIAEAEQYDTVSTGTVQIYVNTDNSYYDVPVGPNSTAGLDTFLVDCLPAGNTTIRVQPGSGDGCGISYRLRFQFIPPPFGNDTEPNEGASDAIFVEPDTDQDGHLSYVGTSTMDHYKLWKGSGGTMRLVISSSTTGPSPAINLWTLNADVFESVTTGENGAIGVDTVYVTTADPDTILLRVSALASDLCGSYRFRYESAPVGVQQGAMPATLLVQTDPGSSGRFTISSSALLSRVDVHDPSGRAIGVASAVPAHQCELDLSRYAAGVYIVHLRSDAAPVRTVRLLRQ